MTVNLSRMLPFCTGLDFSLRESYRKIGQRLARDFNTVSEAVAVLAAPHFPGFRDTRRKISPRYFKVKKWAFIGGLLISVRRFW